MRSGWQCTNHHIGGNLQRKLSSDYLTKPTLNPVTDHGVSNLLGNHEAEPADRFGCGRAVHYGNARSSPFTRTNDAAKFIATDDTVAFCEHRSTC